MPTTPDQTAAIVKIGHFVRDNQMALLDLEAKFYADSTAATTDAEKRGATRINIILSLFMFVF